MQITYVNTGPDSCLPAKLLSNRAEIPIPGGSTHWLTMTLMRGCSSHQKVYMNLATEGYAVPTSS